MSQENLARVREQYARYNAGERAPGRWFWHEDAEYHTPGRIRTTPRIGGSMRSASCSPAGSRPTPT